MFWGVPEAVFLVNQRCSPASLTIGLAEGAGAAGHGQRSSWEITISLFLKMVMNGNGW
jgi:hypothetical protein